MLSRSTWLISKSRAAFERLGASKIWSMKMKHVTSRISPMVWSRSSLQPKHQEP